MLRCLCCVINLLTLFHGSVNHSKHTLAQSAEVNIDCLTLLDITTDGMTALLHVIIVNRWVLLIKEFGPMSRPMSGVKGLRSAYVVDFSVNQLLCHEHGEHIAKASNDSYDCMWHLHQRTTERPHLLTTALDTSCGSEKEYGGMSPFRGPRRLCGRTSETTVCPHLGILLPDKSHDMAEPYWRPHR